MAPAEPDRNEEQVGPIPDPTRPPEAALPPAVDGDDLPQFLNVFIDGTDVRLNDGLETEVGTGSTVVLLPAVAGGQQNRPV